jgi:hypothetical protein
MTWTVCDFRNIKYIKDEKSKRLSVNIYLEKQHAGDFICRGASADAIIKINKKGKPTKYLVCEIKRLEELPNTWFKTEKKSADWKKELDKKRNFWKDQLDIEVENWKGLYPKIVNTDCCEKCYKMKLQNQYAWPIVIAGQLQYIFSNIQYCELTSKKNEKGYKEEKPPLNNENSTRCLIFDKHYENDVKEAFCLLRIKSFDMYTIGVEHTKVNEELKKVHIWAFKKPPEFGQYKIDSNAWLT